MKKTLFFFFLAVLTLTACNDDAPNTLPLTAHLYVRGADVGNKAAAQQRETVHEILVYGASPDGLLSLSFDFFTDPEDYEFFSSVTVDAPWVQQVHWLYGQKQAHEPQNEDKRAFQYNLVDTVHDRLVMDVGNVVDPHTGRIWNLGGPFLRGRNFCIIKCFYDAYGSVLGADTVGYIPNSVMEQAHRDILDMWKAGEVEKVYARFQDAFYFTPCTGEEFRQIKDTTIDWEHYIDDIRQDHKDTHRIEW